MMTKITDSGKQHRMFELIDQWKLSRETKNKFCKGQKLSVHTFNYWLKKYRKQNSDFMPVKIISLEEQPIAVVKFQFPKGISAEVSQSALPDFLRALISAN